MSASSHSLLGRAATLIRQGKERKLAGDAREATSRNPTLMHIFALVVLVVLKHLILIKVYSDLTFPFLL